METQKKLKNVKLTLDEIALLKLLLKQIVLFCDETKGENWFSANNSPINLRTDELDITINLYNKLYGIL